MPRFSRQSLAMLETCHPDLQRLFREVIQHVDCKIIEGARSPERQVQLYSEGKTRTLKSKHRLQPDGYAHAIDVMAYPVNWNNHGRNYLFAGFVRGVAAMLEIRIRTGADWDGDFEVADQEFHDLPHFELAEG